MLRSLIRQLTPGGKPERRVDGRGRRIVVVIECLLNQNARDAGAARGAAMTWEVISLCHAHDAGLLQMPCPEIACLGLERARQPGQPLRSAMLTQASRQGCANISADVVKRIEAYVRAGCQVLAVLGGNPQSPGCAVHLDGRALLPTSGVLMLELQTELRRRGLEIPFRGMRDSDADLLSEDLHWLRGVLSGPVDT
jgi:predicted secreted protein